MASAMVSLTIKQLGSLRDWFLPPERFVPLLRAAFPDLREWPRVVFVLDGEPRSPAPGGRDRATVRRLQAGGVPPRRSG